MSYRFSLNQLGWGAWKITLKDEYYNFNEGRWMNTISVNLTKQENTRIATYGLRKNEIHVSFTFFPITLTLLFGVLARLHSYQILLGKLLFTVIKRRAYECLAPISLNDTKEKGETLSKHHMVTIAISLCWSHTRQGISVAWIGNGHELEGERRIRANLKPDRKDVRAYAPFVIFP